MAPIKMPSSKCVFLPWLYYFMVVLCSLYLLNMLVMGLPSQMYSYGVKIIQKMQVIILLSQNIFLKYCFYTSQMQIPKPLVFLFKIWNMYSARNLEITIRFSLKSWPSERFHRQEMSQIKAEISLCTNVKLICHKNVGLQWYQWIPWFL